MVNLEDWVTVAIRFHKNASLELLDQALFSLSLQTYNKIKVLILIQNGDAVIVEKISTIISQLPFGSTNSEQLVYTSFPFNVGCPTELFNVGINTVINLQFADELDHRADLINISLKFSSTRYISFLDYDDILYSDAIEVLQRNLVTSGAVVAVGGCRRSFVSVNNSNSGMSRYYVDEKSVFPTNGAKSRIDLYIDNFVPIHSYLIDLSKIDSVEDILITLNNKFLEDYELLLRLASLYEFDFSSLDRPVCEYRHRSDGTHTLAGKEAICPEYEKSLENISQLKSELRTNITISEFVDYEARKRRDLYFERGSTFVVIYMFLIRNLNEYPWLKRLLKRIFNMSRALKNKRADALAKIFRG